MVKVLNTNQVKQIEQDTIKSESILSLDLMERAANAFVQWFVHQYKANNKIGVICGTGNNGGDGLAIARLLKKWSYTVNVWIVNGNKETDNFKANLTRLDQLISPLEIKETHDVPRFENQHILIDAIFGTGLTRSVEGVAAKVIEAINQSKATRIAIDVPSGLLLESHSNGAIVKADFTIAFQIPKLAFFLPENSKFVSQWKCLEIGLNRKILSEIETSLFYVERTSIKAKLTRRSTFDHKGDNGKALLVAGSYGKMGACILAAKAALRSGVGLLTIHVPTCGLDVIQSTVPEAMASVDSNNQSLSYVMVSSGFNVIGVGPGLGQSKETINGFAKLLEQSTPMVIDADALNILSQHKEMLKTIHAGSILTPHPKEFERLVGSWKDDFHRLEKQKQLAAHTQCVVVLKGAYSSIVSPEGTVYFNSTGNPGMAKGGTGDVLTGILTSLLAQGYSALDAALIGVYLHGLAGDIAAREKGMDSLVASDLINFLPEAFLKLRS